MSQVSEPADSTTSGFPPEFRSGSGSAGPALVLVGALACAVGLLLPWNWITDTRTTETGELIVDERAANGFAIAGVQLRDEHGAAYGVALALALGIAMIGMILVLVAASDMLLATTTTRVASRTMLAIGTILGVAATIGTLLGYAAFGFTDEMGPGVWAFGLSFVPVLIGAISALQSKA